MVQALLKLKSLMSFNHWVRGKSPFLTKLFRIFGFNGFKLFHSADFQIIANSTTVCLFKVTSRGELPSHKVTYCNRREAYKNIQKKVFDSLGISTAEQHEQRCKASMHIRLASVSRDLDCCPTFIFIIHNFRKLLYWLIEICYFVSFSYPMYWMCMWIHSISLKLIVIFLCFCNYPYVLVGLFSQHNTPHF